MKTRPRLDRNHREIVKALIKMGAEVLSLAPMGGGVFDLLVGYRGRLHLIEIKDGSRPPSSRKLTDDEQWFYNRWRLVVPYSIHIVNNVEEAISALLQ
jgi:hypothetical protein